MADRKPPRKHRAAVTRLLRATGLAHVPEMAPTVELMRDFADQLDEGAGSRVATAYLSIQKDVRRYLDAAPGRPSGTSETAAQKRAAKEEPADEVDRDPAPVQDELAEWKAARGIG